MVLQKRLDYGLNGYQVPVIPRAPRSARRRSSSPKKIEDSQMSAFDLLATVADKLLLEKESSSTGKDQCALDGNTVKEEHQDEMKPIKIEPYDRGCGDMNPFVSDLVSQDNDQKDGFKESHYSQIVSHSGLTSEITNSNCSDRLCTKLEIDRSITEIIGSKVEVGVSGCRDVDECKLENEVKIQIKDESRCMVNIPIGTRDDMCSLDNSLAREGRPAAQASPCSRFKGHLYKHCTPCGSYIPSRGDVKLVNRDDDEISYGCTSPVTRFFRPSPRVGDRRIRKLLASRYWKVAPKSKDEELRNADGELKTVYRNRKNCYKRQRPQRNYPFKKRKIFYHSSVSNSDGGTSDDDISHSLAHGINVDASGSNLKIHAAIGMSSSGRVQHSSFQPRDSHVKLRIQSFRVPELFIEIPETATVGSLKKTVMEAVTAVLSGGLHVGILLQGKKVRDDHKTLQQTGISRDNHMESLGFTLEPSPPQGSPCLCPEESCLLLPSNIPQPPTGYAPESALVHTGTSTELHVANMGNFVASDHDSAPSPIDSTIDKHTTADSKALIAVPTMNVEALAMVPAQHKSKRSEISQRRIRRPFSVTEVEALIQSVEKLGPGRWRDVKMRVFDNAEHRTYVDLKDKWKTLVHTARISPQQRRGEPVPQELLDRVLVAHAHWSEQQQLRQQQETCLLV